MTKTNPSRKLAPAYSNSLNSNPNNLLTNAKAGRDVRERDRSIVSSQKSAKQRNKNTNKPHPVRGNHKQPTVGGSKKKTTASKPLIGGLGPIDWLLFECAYPDSPHVIMRKEGNEVVFTRSRFLTGVCRMHRRLHAVSEAMSRYTVTKAAIVRLGLWMIFRGSSATPGLKTVLRSYGKEGNNG